VGVVNTEIIGEKSKDRNKKEKH